MKLSEITNANEINVYNFTNETTKGSYEDRMIEFRRSVSKMIKTKWFYSPEPNVYGIYFADIFDKNGEQEIDPVFIKIPLSPLGIDILVAHFQNIGSEVDQSVALSEEFIVELLEKYYNGEKITNKYDEAESLDNTLYLGIHHNWELTLLTFINEIEQLEKDPNIVADIERYVLKHR